MHLIICFKTSYWNTQDFLERRPEGKSSVVEQHSAKMKCFPLNRISKEKKRSCYSSLSFFSSSGTDNCCVALQADQIKSQIEREEKEDRDIAIRSSLIAVPPAPTKINIPTIHMILYFP